MQSLSCWTFFQGEGGGSSHCHWISGKYHQMIANNEKMVLLCFNIRLLSGWLVCFHPDTIAAGWALGNLSSVNMELMLFQREGQKKKPNPSSNRNTNHWICHTDYKVCRQDRRRCTWHNRSENSTTAAKDQDLFSTKQSVYEVIPQWLYQHSLLLVLYSFPSVTNIYRV